ncbi:hypothetical protein ScPMuIL_002715 [Solemya velum]
MVQMFKEEGRSGVSRVAVIFTDGLSYQPDKLHGEVLQANRKGIQVVGVGFGDLYFPDEITKIVPNKEHRFVIKDFENKTDVTRQRNGLAQVLCELARTPGQQGSSLETEIVDETEPERNDPDGKCELVSPEYDWRKSGLFEQDNAFATYTENQKVNIYGNKAIFSGTGFLHIYKFSNLEYTGVIQLQFRPTNTQNTQGEHREALLTNCLGTFPGERASIEVVVDYLRLKVQVKLTKSNSEVVELSASVHIGADNIMFLIITKEKVSLIVNYITAARYTGSAPIKKEQSGFILGQGCNPDVDNFRGQIWNLRVYNCIPNAFLLTHLYGR